MNVSRSPSLSSAPLLVDSRETARLLGIGTRTLWTLTARGDIRAVRIGRSVRYSVTAIHDYIARAAGGAT